VGRGGENHCFRLMAEPTALLCEVSHIRPVPGMIASESEWAPVSVADEVTG